MESGRRLEDVANAGSLQVNPVWQSWAAWGVGTRVIARRDEVDAEGRTNLLSRTFYRLEAIDQEAARISSQDIRWDEEVQAAQPQSVPRLESRQFLVASRAIGPQTVYWRHYDARVAFEKPGLEKAGPGPAGRKGRRRARDDAAGDPREAVPAEFNCAVIDVVTLDLAEDPGASDDPSLAGPGTAVTVRRSYHSTDAPGWTVIIDDYSAKLDERGEPAEMELLARWRIERILRPGEPDPTLEELREGFRPQ